MRVEIMSNPSDSQSENLRLQLARKLVFIVLIVLVVTVGLAILIQQLRSSAFFLQVSWTDILLGLVCGFASRLFFRRQMGVLRFAAACAVYIVGLLLLGVFTGWKYGIDPFKSNPKDADWADLGQLVMGMGIIILALQAWYHPVLELQIAPEPVVVTPLPPSKRRPVKRPRRTPRSRVQTAPTVAVAVEAPRPKRKRGLRRKTSLQLSDREEHRCPYCLELIEPHDPRGTVECKICHTLHHADCWAITGTCQVPHLNT
jgi:hypothetical protein